MLADDVVDRLASLPLFEPVPRSELEWLVAHGAVLRLAQDEMLRDIGAPTDDMWVVLDGRVCAHVRTAGGRRGGGSSTWAPVSCWASCRIPG